MKNISIILWVLLLLSFAFSQMQGRRPTQYGFEVNAKPPIYYDLYITFNGESLNPQLNVLFNIQNDLLFFTKSDDGYRGGYDIALAVKDMSTNSTVFSNLWKEKIFEKEFEQTNSKQRYQVNGKKFDTNLAGGDYEVHLELTDEATGNSFKSKRKLTVPKQDSTQFFSEIKFIRPVEDLSAEIILAERRTSIEFNHDILVNFELMHTSIKPIKLTSLLYLVQDERNLELLRAEYTLPTEQKLIRHSEKFDKKILQEGNYQLTYILETDQGKTEIDKKFQVIWYQKPLYLYDNELAVPPLKYIISEEEWDKLEDLSDEELSKWIKEFWQKKDPDPDTPLNEIMVEFYDRVLQANKKYAGEYIEGWTTDRGKSLILYGEPDRVDAYRYKLKSKPYEIWYYESENKKLIFIDVDEDSSYPLMSVEDIGESDNE